MVLGLFERILLRNKEFKFVELKMLGPHIFKVDDGELIFILDVVLIGLNQLHLLFQPLGSYDADRFIWFRVEELFFFVHHLNLNKKDYF